MRNGGYFEGEVMKIYISVFNHFADCVRNLVRFAHTETNGSVLAANYYESAELHNTSAFDGFGYAVYCYDLFSKIEFGSID